MLDEEELPREELRRYSELVDGEPQIRPFEIPPLVSQRVPWLRPAATNKMFNAQLAVRRSPGVQIEPVAYPTAGDRITENYALMAPLVGAANSDPRLSR